MQNIDTQAHVLTELNIEVVFEELVKKIRTGAKRPDILATAEQTLQKVSNIWDPGIVYRWLPFVQSKTDLDKSIVHSNNPVILELGHSTRFVKEASSHQKARMVVFIL